MLMATARASAEEEDDYFARCHSLDSDFGIMYESFGENSIGLPASYFGASSREGDAVGQLPPAMVMATIWARPSWAPLCASPHIAGGWPDGRAFVRSPRPLP